MTQIISIHSYRGGTGKSNLTANLATLMALQGKRIVVIDTDIQSPGIHNIFDVDQNEIKYTLNDYLWGKIKLKDAVYDVTQAAGVKEKGQIFLVPASINPDEIAHVLSEGYNVSLLNEGVKELIKDFNLDYVFLDTHPGLNKEIFLSIAISHVLIIVLRPDRQDFQGTAVLVDIARQLMIPKMMLAINKVSKQIDFEDLKTQVINTYQTEVGGIFPSSEEMLLLGSNGIFCQEYPQHLWTKELLKLAKKIIN
jgi:MinD-like ATPase involved in chromosome partitioning or flagellar assembly